MSQRNIYFWTLNDLKLWVSERSGEDTTQEENLAISYQILAMNEFPKWGMPADEFLGTLPDDLFSLIENQKAKGDK